MTHDFSMHDDFGRALLDAIPEEPRAFPHADYIPDGDCVEFFISNESYYAERVDDLLTVYYGQESGTVSGAMLKSIHRFVKQFAETSPGFRIDVSDGPVRLSLLFTAGMWRQGDLVLGRHYRKIRDTAEEHRVEVDIPMQLCEG